MIEISRLDHFEVILLKFAQKFILHEQWRPFVNIVASARHFILRNTEIAVMFTLNQLL